MSSFYLLAVVSHFFSVNSSLRSFQVIGLDAWGYGRILGQCQMTTKIFWCLWLVLSRPDDPFICTPLQDIPEGYRHTVQVTIGNKTHQVTEAERICREDIMGKSMSEIYQVNDHFTLCGQYFAAR